MEESDGAPTVRVEDGLTWVLRIISLTPAGKEEDAEDYETNQHQAAYDGTGYDAP
jgi:hypothetical protein